MATDSGMVGGLGAAGDRLGRERGPSRAPDPPPRPVARRTNGDSIELSGAAVAVFELLQQRVIAFTRPLAPSSQPVLAIVHAAPPADPLAAVARIHSAQLWCLGGAAVPTAALWRAFAQGLDEVEAIVRECAGADTAALAWLAGVRAARS